MCSSSAAAYRIDIKSFRKKWGRRKVVLKILLAVDFRECFHDVRFFR